MDIRLLLARRYLMARHQVTLIAVITGISVLGVAVGVAALIVVLSVMNGFYRVVRDLLVSVDPHVRIVSTTPGGLAVDDSLEQYLRGLPHVAEVTAYVEGKALLLYEGEGEVNKVVIVRGVEPEALEAMGAARVFGSVDLQRREGRPGILVGMPLARRLGLLPASSTEPASQVGLLSAPALEQLLTQPLAPPPLIRFEVRGLYQLTSGYDESHVFVALEEAQRLFRMGDRVDGVALRLDDVAHAAALKALLEQQLDTTRYRVQTWYDLQRGLYDVMRLEKWGASLILALIVVVAAFSIVGALTMVVIEKRRDIGVLQAMGLSRKRVRQVFLLAGLLIGVAGAGLGLLLGVGLALLQQHFQLVPLPGAEAFLIHAYPVAIEITDLLGITLAALVLCVLAALYPAARAAAIEPAQAVHLDI